MKRYLVFQFDMYYPSGGWSDFVGSFDNVEDAVNSLKGINGRFYHIVDSVTGEKLSRMNQEVPSSQYDNEYE